MEPENTTTPESKQHKRFTRSRVLLGMVVLCLLLWSINAIHHAKQPKYQGKTAEEWFGEYELIREFSLRETSAEAFRNLGTNGVWFLWKEYCRKDSKPTAWIMAQKDRLLGIKRPWWANSHELERQCKAMFLLRELGANAEPLIPEILSKLSSCNPDEASTMAYLLGTIQRQPEIAVPAIHQSLLSTNLNISQRINNYISLAKFGDKAKSSLPELKARFTNPVYTNNGENLHLARAILLINGPGPELGLFTNNLVFGDFMKSYSSISRMESCGTNARPAAAVLIRFAQTLTNEFDSNQVMQTVRIIDPEGIYQKP
jgi:hypothetical protein